MAAKRKKKPAKKGGVRPTTLGTGIAGRAAGAAVKRAKRQCKAMGMGYDQSTGSCK